MSIQISWKTLYNVKDFLQKRYHLQPDTPIIFLLKLRDNSTQKKVIKFENFLHFFWFLYDNPKFHVKALIVTNESGDILYKQQIGSGLEIIPSNGNSFVISSWPKLNKKAKSTYIDILVSQIQDAN